MVVSATIGGSVALAGVGSPSSQPAVAAVGSGSSADSAVQSNGSGRPLSHTSVEGAELATPVMNGGLVAPATGEAAGLGLGVDDEGQI